MNLTIFYPVNDTGAKILNAIEEEWDEVTYRQTSMQGIDYYQIDVGDNFSPLSRIINTPRSIRNAFTEDNARGILSENKINFGVGEEETINRTYSVLVCDMTLVSMKVKVHGKSKPQTRFIKERENSKVADLAKRVVYLLGLDIGMVTIVLNGKRRYKVDKINPGPEIRDKDTASLLKYIRKWYALDHELKKAEVKLGADPEFMMLNSKNNKIVSASQFFPRDGVVGCDNIRMPNRSQRPVAEIRPRPELSPVELSANIRQALNSASRMAPYRNVKWIAGSQPINGYSIGGHIHFSNIKLSGGLLRALDNYIGIPVFLIENPTTALKRRRKYGFLGDYRFKDYGGFEYRTPGSWLVSEKITTAVLCLAKIVGSHYLELLHNYLNTVDAQRAFYSGDQEYFRTIFFSLWSNLKTTAMFNDYVEDLEVIYDMILNNETWDERIDFRKTWNIKAVPKKNYSGKMRTTSSGPRAVQSISSSDSAVQTRSRRSSSSSSGSRMRTGTRGTRVRASGTVPPQAIIPATTSINMRNRRSRPNTPAVSGRIITSGQVRRSHIVR
ncbi:putative amidoligase domain-containing protein [Syntrophomonas erecta]